jgi:hypothetical protein
MHPTAAPSGFGYLGHLVFKLQQISLDTVVIGNPFRWTIKYKHAPGGYENLWVFYAVAFGWTIHFVEVKNQAYGLSIWEIFLVL